MASFKTITNLLSETFQLKLGEHYVQMSSYIQTHDLTETHGDRSGGLAPDALTSSHSPLLAFSPLPVPISLKWSQEANTTTMNRAAGEKGIEKARNGDRGKKLKKLRTLWSLLSSATYTKMSFWHDTKEPLYVPPFSCLFLPSIPFSQVCSSLIT